MGIRLQFRLIWTETQAQIQTSTRCHGMLLQRKEKYLMKGRIHHKEACTNTVTGKYLHV